MLSKDILASMEEMGYEGRTASSTVPDEALPRLRASGGRVKPGSKPVTAVAEQLPARRPERDEPAAAAEEAPAEEADVVVTLPEAEPVEVEPAGGTVRSCGCPSPLRPPPRVRRVRRVRAHHPRVHRPGPCRAAGGHAGRALKLLFSAGEMVTVTQSLSEEAIELVASELGRSVTIAPRRGGRGGRGRGGRRVAASAPAAGGDRHGPRRPRQDPALDAIRSRTW